MAWQALNPKPLTLKPSTLNLALVGAAAAASPPPPAKMEVVAPVIAEVAAESHPCAELLLCVQCTRPLDLRSCIDGRGLHSSTFRLNVSTICWIRWVHDFPPVY